VDRSLERNLFDISGKYILITGASSGIGREIAKVLAAQGAILAISGRNEQELEKTLQMLEGNQHIAIPADLSNIMDTAFLFDEAVKQNGKLDGMIYSAGVMPVVPLKNTTISKMNGVLMVNFCAFVDMVRNYSKRKNSSGGSIIGISSIASETPDKGQVMYASSKAAMNAAVRVIAQEVADKGIRINTILPGNVDSERMTEELFLRLGGNQLLGPVAPTDVAAMCVYLLSDAAKSISGRPLYLDGAKL
jgi:NAD(P)-dependent dehydrogenase (short-subunit alcohol dehydrogenase family)